MRQVRYVWLLAFLIWCCLTPGYCGDHGTYVKGVNSIGTVRLCTDWDYDVLHAQVQPLCAIALTILTAGYLNRRNKKVFLLSTLLSLALAVFAVAQPLLTICMEECRNNGFGTLISVPFGFLTVLLLIYLFLVLYAARRRDLYRFLAISSVMLSIGGLLLPQLASYVIFDGVLAEHFVGMR